MNIIRNVRKRRSEKMRTLRHKKNPYQNEWIDPQMEWFHSPPRNQLDLQRDPQDPRLEDPEYAWKYGGVNPWGSPSDYAMSQSSVRLNSGSKRSIGLFTINIAVCVGIFLLTFLMFQSDHTWAKKGQQWVKQVMTDELNLPGLSGWYDRYFTGSPAFLPSFRGAKDPTQPVHPAQAGLQEKLPSPFPDSMLTQMNQTDNMGVILQGNSSEPIVSIAEGRVIYVTEADVEQKTIIIQHANQIQSIYGGLQTVSVTKNEWLKSGDPIGYVKPDITSKGRLFLAIKKDNQYVNPMDVIVFD